MQVFINPGTEARGGATEDNAKVTAQRLADDIGYKHTIGRREDADNDGWFGFDFGGVPVDIPGDDPDQVCEGRPWVSRRLYVDGSSWLYGFAVGILADKLFPEDAG